MRDSTDLAIVDGAAPTALQFREVCSHYPTGVVVITAGADREAAVGMAANSVTSVSLEPPLMAVCPARSSTTWPAIRGARRFCINVMGGDHAEIVQRFALRGADRFAGVATHQRDGSIALDGAAAWIDCLLLEEHDAGDHTIAVAAVLGAEARGTAAPLVFWRGAYGGFKSSPLPGEVG